VPDFYEIKKLPLLFPNSGSKPVDSSVFKAISGKEHTADLTTFEKLSDLSGY